MDTRLRLVGVRASRADAKRAMSGRRRNIAAWGLVAILVAMYSGRTDAGEPEVIVWGKMQRLHNWVPYIDPVRSEELCLYAGAEPTGTPLVCATSLAAPEDWREDGTFRLRAPYQSGPLTLSIAPQWYVGSALASAWGFSRWEKHNASARPHWVTFELQPPARTLYGPIVLSIWSEPSLTPTGHVPPPTSTKGWNTATPTRTKTPKPTRTAEPSVTATLRNIVRLATLEARVSALETAQP